MRGWKRKLVTLVTTGALVACTVMQPLSLDMGQLRHGLKPGDVVEVTTVSGEHLRLTLDAVDDAGLHAGSTFVTYGDLQSISRKQVSTGRTTLLILGIIAAGAAAAGGGGGGGGYGGGSGGSGGSGGGGPRY